MLTLCLCLSQTECSNSSLVLKIMGCGDSDRAATKQLIIQFSSSGHVFLKPLLHHDPFTPHAHRHHPSWFVFRMNVWVRDSS